MTYELSKLGPTGLVLVYHQSWWADLCMQDYWVQVSTFSRYNLCHAG